MGLFSRLFKKKDSLDDNVFYQFHKNDIELTKKKLRKIDEEMFEEILSDSPPKGMMADSNIRDQIGKRLKEIEDLSALWNAESAKYVEEGEKIAYELEKKEKNLLQLAISENEKVEIQRTIKGELERISIEREIKSRPLNDMLENLEKKKSEVEKMLDPVTLNMLRTTSSAWRD